MGEIFYFFKGLMSSPFVVHQVSRQFHLHDAIPVCTIHPLFWQTAEQCGDFEVAYKNSRVIITVNEVCMTRPPNVVLFLKPQLKNRSVACFSDLSFLGSDDHLEAIIDAAHTKLGLTRPLEEMQSEPEKAKTSTESWKEESESSASVFSIHPDHWNNVKKNGTFLIMNGQQPHEFRVTVNEPTREKDDDGWTHPDLHHLHFTGPLEVLQQVINATHQALGFYPRVWVSRAGDTDPKDDERHKLEMFMLSSLNDFGSYELLICAGVMGLERGDKETLSDMVLKMSRRLATQKVSLENLRRLEALIRGWTKK